MPEFGELSAKSAEHLKNGMYQQYILDLQQMAEMLNAEGLRTDELKILMLEYFFTLNCSRKIDPILTEKVKVATAATGMTENEMQQLYLDTIRIDTAPCRFMGPWDSLYVLKLCISGRRDEAEEILVKSSGTV